MAEQALAEEQDRGVPEEKKAHPEDPVFRESAAEPALAPDPKVFFLFMILVFY